MRGTVNFSYMCINTWTTGPDDGRRWSEPDYARLTMTLTDRRHGHGPRARTAVTVNNVAPDVKRRDKATSPINENGTASTFSGTIGGRGDTGHGSRLERLGLGRRDSVADDTHACRGRPTSASTHQYLDDDPTVRHRVLETTDPITLTLTDDDTGTDLGHGQQ